jgi:hypothetical protein
LPLERTQVGVVGFARYCKVLLESLRIGVTGSARSAIFVRLWTKCLLLERNDEQQRRRGQKGIEEEEEEEEEQEDRDEWCNAGHCPVSMRIDCKI